MVSRGRKKINRNRRRKRRKKGRKKNKERIEKFYQEEEGIRDGNVSGDQTCALESFLVSIGGCKALVFTSKLSLI